MTQPAKKILVVRNDKLGDFMLAFPSFALLKQSQPDAEVHALVPRYTQPMAELCPWIDRVIVDPGKKSGILAFATLLWRVRAEKYGAIVSLFSTTRVGWLVWLVRIPYRLAPATKIAQIFYNVRLTQRRSRSEKPEYEFNLDLVRRYLTDHNKASVSVSSPYLRFDAHEVAALKQNFCEQFGISTAQKLVFVHPGSGGSANNLSLAQYAQLASLLAKTVGVSVVITAGPGEEAMARRLVADLNHQGAVVYLYVSVLGLVAFAKHIAFSDLFVCGSTGPLHIAGALNRKTAAFYPRSRVMSSLRWQTINDRERQLAFAPAETAGETDMQSIDIAECARKISELL